MTRADWMEAERAFSRRHREEPVMGYGKWSRWGRGSCEGYCLEFGVLFRFDIRPGPRTGVNPPDAWHASSRMQALGTFPTFEAAKEACEAEAQRQIEAAVARGETGGDMILALDHWKAFQDLKSEHRHRPRAQRRLHQ